MANEQAGSTRVGYKEWFREGFMRSPSGIFRMLIMILAIGVSIFEIWLGAFGSMDLYQYSAIFYPFVLGITFLLYSSRQSVTKGLPTWMDIFYSLLSFGIWIFFLVNSSEYLKRIPQFAELTSMETFVGIALVLLTLEATRRTLGSSLTIIVLIFLAYTFLGHLIPGAYSHRLITLNHFIDDMVYTTNGIFGTTIGVAATYVFMFVLFGAFYTQAGGGDFFFKFAAMISGRSAGGTAKVGVISSGMFGMISGSPTSDVLTTGSINIPIMKKVGLSPVFAGAVESAASAGGSICPPIMGSAVFLMAEYAGIPYSDIVIAAIIPAILYYLGIFLQVHFRSKKLNLPTMDDVPKFKQVMKDGWVHLLPIIFLIWGIEHGFTAPLVAIMTCGLIIVLSWFNPQRRIGLGNIIKACEESLLRVVPVTLACAAAGMFIDEIMLTGLASKFGTLIFQFTYGNVFLSLVATAFMCIIFGMGLPTSTSYILTAALAAPLLINLGVSTLSAHLFIVYYSVLSCISPPVATACIAAGSIAQADPNKIGWASCRLALVAFIMPFMFVYEPALLMDGSVGKIVESLLTAGLGITCLAAGFEGYYGKNLNFLERILIIASGVCMIFPQTVMDITGIALMLIVILPKYLGRRKQILTKNEGDELIWKHKA